MKRSYCPHCGKRIASDALFCGHCGQALPATNPFYSFAEPPLPHYRSDFDWPAEPSERAAGTPWYAYLSIGLLLTLSAGLVFGLILLLPGWLRGDEPTVEPGRVVVAPAIATELPSPTVPASTTASATPLAPATLTRTLPDTPVPTQPPPPDTAQPRTNTPLPPPTARPPATTIETFSIGWSSQGTPLEVVRIGNGPDGVLFIGGIHAGKSPGTVGLAREAASYFSANPTLIPQDKTLYVLLSLNPDSVDYRQEPAYGRLNGRGVDPNRNWPCNWQQHPTIGEDVVRNSGGESWLSEPETIAVWDFIRQNNIVAVVVWDARANDGLVSPGGCNEYSSVSQPLLLAYGRAAGYRLIEQVDQIEAVAGDITNWLDSQGIPAIFVFLPDYHSMDWNDNLAGMLAVLRQ